MKRQSTCDVSAWYGEKAAIYLSTAGIRILARNFYCRGGETDLISSDDRYLISFEVRYRSGKKDRSPSSATGSVKRRRFSFAAQQYLYRQHSFENMPVRFGAVGIPGEELA